FTGTADANSTVQLFANGILKGTGTASGGVWSIPSSTLGDGTYSITAKEVFGAFTGAAGTALTPVVIDTIAPSPPSTPVLDPASDSGTAGDNLTKHTTPTFTGTAEANSTVQLFADGNPTGVPASASGGVWSITTSALGNGPHDITATATD